MIGDPEHLHGVQVRYVFIQLRVCPAVLGVESLQLKLGIGGARLLQAEELFQILLAEIPVKINRMN